MPCKQDAAGRPNKRQGYTQGATAARGLLRPHSVAAGSAQQAGVHKPPKQRRVAAAIPGRGLSSPKVDRAGGTGVGAGGDGGGDGGGGGSGGRASVDPSVRKEGSSRGVLDAYLDQPEGPKAASSGGPGAEVVERVSGLKRAVVGAGGVSWGGKTQDPGSGVRK